MANEVQSMIVTLGRVQAAAGVTMARAAASWAQLTWGCGTSLFEGLLGAAGRPDRSRAGDQTISAAHAYVRDLAAVCAFSSVSFLDEVEQRRNAGKSQGPGPAHHPPRRHRPHRRNRPGSVHRLLY